MYYSLFLTVLSVPFAFWVDFVPNEKTKNIGFNCALIASTVWLTILYYHLLKNPTQEFLQLSLLKKGIFFLLFPIFPIICSWFFFVHSIPALFTYTLGQPYKVHQTVKKIHSKNSRSCDFRIESKALTNAVPDSMCINEEFYNDASNEVLLVGKQSFLGENYESIYGRLSQKED